jgi:hypothetical protein
MTRKLLIIRMFAFVGFAVPWALLAFSYFARLLGRAFDSRVFLWICPTSIFSIALDNASWWVALLCWLLIGVTNAILYGAVGIIVSVFVRNQASV